MFVMFDLFAWNPNTKVEIEVEKDDQSARHALTFITRPQNDEETC
jgi:hypothetical protein